MKTSSRRTWITRTSVAAIGLGFGAGLLWLSIGNSQTQPELRINRAGQRKINDSFVAGTNVVPDFYRLKYDPHLRVDFHVTSNQDSSIFVLATGVQIQTPSGWKVVAEEPRTEIWRLKSGIARELYVERQANETWRAYVRYGTEMKGPPLLKAKLREAWLIRSFSNWTGKAWGGGRWSGVHELFSEEIEEGSEH